MSKLKVDQFVDLVKKSGLVDNERLNAALSGVDQSVRDSGVVASILTKADLLTEWQSEKLLQGKHKGFYLGRYKLLRHLGTGGMGAVFLAEHVVMKHRVAIKTLPSHLAAHKSYLERFHQEARASARLNHPNMVRAFDVDNQEHIHYLVMEFVDGCDLQAVVSRVGALPYETAADYIRQAADGLAYAHQSGLIHRDIKPSNLLIDREGTVKILDMGLARFSDETQGSLTKEYDQKMIGTVDYQPPEQATDSHNVDARADIYSLGCTLYFTLSGDAPFPTGTIPQRVMQHQTATPKDVRIDRPDAPEGLLAICAKMMAKSPDDRYQSAEEVSQALKTWLEDFKSGSPRAAQSYAPPRGPVGPSKNENLDLAPLEEDLPKSAKAPQKPTESKELPPAKKQEEKAGEKSVVKGEAGTKSTTSSLKNGDAGKFAAKEKKPFAGEKSSAKSAARETDDLMDELLSAPPPTQTPMLVPPSVVQARKQQQAEPEESDFPIWLVLTCVGGAAGILAIGLAAWWLGFIQ